MTTAHPAVDVERLLAEGELEPKGRILPASNLTFLCDVTLGDRTEQCVYKPVSGERPLWDFPEGTLAAREVAAYAVSEALGWHVVPLTILRDGPAGLGMVQIWCHIDETQDPVDLVPEGEVPEGFLHVLDAVDGNDRPVSLVHEDSTALRRMAVFDALVNNADRKGGHILPMPEGHRYGVDHGVTFHVEDKLRTVLWGWAEGPLDPDDMGAVIDLRAQLAHGQSHLRSRLAGLITDAEMQALDDRCARLLDDGVMPLPSGQWPAIPWPAF